MIMYLGPGIPGVVKRKQIFNYEPTGVIKEAAARAELAKYLFVPMENIVEAKRSLKTPGSLLNVAFKKVHKEIWR